MTNDMEGLRKVAEEATNSDHDGRFAFRQAATPQVVLALLSELEAVKGELAKCGRENCMGQDVDGVSRWVRKEALDRAEAALVSLKGGGGSSVAESGSTASPKSDGLCKSEGGF